MKRAYSRFFKTVMGAAMALVMVMTCLAGVAFAAPVCEVCDNAAVQELSVNTDSNTDITTGGYYKLAADVSVAGLTNSVNFKSKTNYFLCLNGHSLDAVVNIINGANVTICDCQGGGYVKTIKHGVPGLHQTSLLTTSYLTVKGGSFGTIEVSPSANLHVIDGQFSKVTSTGTVVIDGGTFSNAASYPLSNHQCHNQLSPPHNESWYGDMTINGGTFTGKTAGFYNADGATAVIKGGTFTGEECGVMYYSWSKGAIEGGTITGTDGPGLKFSSPSYSTTVEISGGSITGSADSYAIDMSSRGVAHLSGDFQLQGGLGDVILRSGSSDEYSTLLYLDGPISESELSVSVTENSNSQVKDLIRIPDDSTATVDELGKITVSDSDALVIVDPADKSASIIYPDFITGDPDAEDPSVETEPIPGYTETYRWFRSDTKSGAGAVIGGADGETLPDSKIDRTGWYWCEVTWTENADPTNAIVKLSDRVYYHIHNLCADDSCTQHTELLTFKQVKDLSELQGALAAGGSYMLAEGSYAASSVTELVVSADTNLCLGDLASADFGKARIIVETGAELNLCCCGPMSGEIKFVNAASCASPVVVNGALNLYSAGITADTNSTYAVENNGILLLDGAVIESTGAGTAVYHAGSLMSIAGGADIVADDADVLLANGKFVTLMGGADALADVLIVDTVTTPTAESDVVAAKSGDSTVLDDAALAKIKGSGEYITKLDSQSNIVFGLHNCYINGFCVCGYSDYQPCAKDANGAYVITNAGQLYWFADRVNNHSERNANAILTADITVPETIVSTYGTLYVPQWTPIGSYASQYNGDFDGQEHFISGLRFNNSGADYVGLFSALAGAADVENITVKDSYFSARSCVGAIAGYNYNNIVNCHYDGTTIIAAADDDGYSYAGGICGQNTWTVEDCTNSGDVTGAGAYVGGICGYSSRSLTGSTNSGTVTGAVMVGGIVGSGSASECTNSGAVRALGSTPFDYDGTSFGYCSFAGGISGAVHGSGYIYDCSNTGTVISEGNIAGGIVGLIEDGLVKECTNESFISAPAIVGGIAGGSMAGMEGCINKGSVSAAGSIEFALMGIDFGKCSFAGGIAGFSLNYVEASSNTAIVIGDANMVGGVSGGGSYHYECENSGSVAGGAIVGGIVGGGLGTIESCSNSGDIIALGNDTILDNELAQVVGGPVKLHMAGGISGWSLQGDVMLCSNTGAVSGQAGVGGICGAFSGDYLENCYNLGDLDVTAADLNAREMAVAGGIAGVQASEEAVRNCYNAGKSVGSFTDVAPVVGSDGGLMFAAPVSLNTYYLASADGTDGARTAESFASGEVAWLLNGGGSNDPADDLVWGQELGVDPYPIFGEPRVYYGYKEGDTENSPRSYSNDLRYDTCPVSIASAFIELEDESFVYDGREKEAVVVSVSLLRRAVVDPSAYDVSSAKGTDAGTYSVTVTAKAGSGYFGSATAAFSITPKPITAVVTPADKVYDGTTAAAIASVEFTGLVDGDEVALSAGSANFEDAAVGEDKVVTFTGYALSGRDANNYILQPIEDGTADITEAPARPNPNPSAAGRENPSTGVRG